MQSVEAFNQLPRDAAGLLYIFGEWGNFAAIWQISSTGGRPNSFNMAMCCAGEFEPTNYPPMADYNASPPGMAAVDIGNDAQLQKKHK